MSVLSLIKSVPTAVVKTTGKILLKTKQAKPQLLVGGGLLIATTAFVVAIINARKLDETIDATTEKVEAIEQKKKDIQNAVNLTEEEIKKQLKDVDKELNKAKAEGIFKIFCLIGAPTIAFAGGIAMIVGGHLILFRRFGQVSVAFAALQEKFGLYRKMNIAEHGEECDERYIYGITGVTDVKDKITDENGKEKTVKNKVPVVEDGNQASLYSFVFSEATSRMCPKDPVNTISFLQSQEKFWNVYMHMSGKPVTLSMVLDDIGIELDPDDPKNDYILIAGWRPNGDGDCKIDFGIKRAINKPAYDMLENVVMLNFNCDGNIYHSTRYTKDGRKVS